MLLPGGHRRAFAARTATGPGPRGARRPGRPNSILSIVRFFRVRIILWLGRLGCYDWFARFAREG